MTDGGKNNTLPSKWVGCCTNVTNVLFDQVIRVIRPFVLFVIKKYLDTMTENLSRKS